MDRNYTKIADRSVQNRAGLINLSTSFKPLMLVKSKASPIGSTDRLIKNEILGKLSGRVLETLTTSMKSVYLDRLENIYRPDEAIRFIYFPETAVFSESKILPDGRTLEIMMIGKEGVTGVASLFNAQPPTNFTNVLQAGRAFRIDTEFLIDELSDKPEISVLVSDYLNRFINDISQKVICSGFHLIENRLCSWLLMLQDKTGSHQLNLTHEQIALSLGAHRPSITQITKKLREDELIDYSRGNISIINRNKMEFTACPCYLTTC